jgi:hypothetical protein
MWAGKERQHNVIPSEHPNFALIKLIEAALRASWGEDVCNDKDRLLWTQENPAFGQCVVSTLVLMELLHEGKIVEDSNNDHFWFLDEFGEIDLTREQFPKDILIQATSESTKESLLTGPGASAARTKERYLVLLERVKYKLNAEK